MTHTQQKKPDTDIAIIGMGCIFPGANGSREVWRLMTHGEDAITDVPSSHWSAADYYDEDPGKADHTYCTRGGFLSPLSYDPTEFGIPPNSLEAIDTSQLLGLIAAKMALEDAGYGENGRDFDRDRTSVILGVTGTQELVIPLSSRLGHPQWRKALDECGIPASRAEAVIDKISQAYVPWRESSFPGLLGNVVAGRISNRLNLGGTNTVVDAACASSLSAVNMAILELQAGRGDMMITGGVDTLNDIFMHMCFAKTGVLSHSGDARPFSEKADGTVLGEGIGILILKRLTDARKAGDRIYAVIKTMASSSDGRSQSIYAPSAAGQIKALRKAYDTAGFSAATVRLIEAHGTGTRVGDAVEFESLKTVFAASGAAPNQCALGSIKSMIGHTKAAAGAAGLIKAALALYHKTLPPTIKAETPDPKLDINHSPFYLNGRNKPWFAAENYPRRAAVSAFGFGGSNFHTVLEEDPLQHEAPAWDGSVMPAAFSARTIEALLERLNTFREVLLQPDTTDRSRYFNAVMAACKESCRTFSHDAPFRFTAVLQRSETFTDDWQHRLTESIETLKRFPRNVPWNIPDTFFGHSAATGGLAFVFPGQGSQYPDMGRDLVCCFPEARHTLEHMQRHPAIMTQATDRLLHHIYPPPEHLQPLSAAREQLKNTDIAQPAIGAISLSMLKILERFGVQPAAVCGHSYGELTALYTAGCITEDALIALSATRGRLMAACPEKGAMLAVKAPLDTLSEIMSQTLPEVILANRNAPEQGVLSGSVSAIEKAREICRKKGFQTVRLPVSSAFHSPLIASAAEPFQAFLKTIDFSEARIPVFANTTGSPYPADPDEVRELLGRQLMNPVDFMPEIENLYASGIRTFLEVGPKSVLTGLIRAILDNRDFNAVALDGSGGRDFGVADLARCLCRISAAGHFADLSQWENPVVPSRKQLMSIPMTGANVKPAVKPAERMPKLAENEPSPHKQPSVPEKKVMNKTRTSSSPVVLNDALKAVQEGMKSMQQLQRQTAHTHQKFLETQSEASRTLQAMMDQTRRMAEIAMGISPQERSVPVQPEADATFPDTTTMPAQHVPNGFTGAQPPSFTEKSETAAHRPTPSPAAVPPEPSGTVSVLPQAPHPQPGVETTLQENASRSVQTSAAAPVHAREESPSNRDMEQKLLEIVSQLTGYPTEMLDRGMDIESDLGIDSIKRVEILSALEENIPDLPAIPPETMGTLKTLGQIADYLKSRMAGKAPSAAEPAAPGAGRTPQPESALPATDRQTASEAAPTLPKTGIETRLLEIVAQLTGYPEEMLDPGMDIESDLGIDSIKRVEILSALEENIPDLPAIPPETMGTLKTLGQIADYLKSRMAGKAPSAAEPAAPGAGRTPQPESALPATDRQTASEAAPTLPKTGIETRLLEIVAQLTGYPEEMLDPGMDIESDLGIDSIKRVEILSALEESITDLPAIPPETMGTLKTLGQIADYLGGQPSDTDTPSMTDISSSDKDVSKSAESQAHDASCDPDRMEAAPIHIDRKIITLTERAPAEEMQVQIPADRTLFVMNDSAGLGQSMVRELTRRNIKATVFEADTLLTQRDPFFSAGGLILIHDMAAASLSPDDSETDDSEVGEPSSDTPETITETWNETDETFLKQAFEITSKAAESLIASAAEGGAVFATITAMDGAFGFHDGKFTHPLQGALAGLAKTAAVEWEEVCCHAIDIAPEMKNERIENETASLITPLTQRLIHEIMCPGPVELGIRPDTTLIPALQSAVLPEGDIALDEKDVVVITGGARGVTAASAHALAECKKPVLVMIGRSPAPQAEPRWLNDLEEEAAIKKAILAREFNGRVVKPRELEAAFKKHMTNREMLRNLQKMESTGAKVYYYSADVRQADKIKGILEEIRQKYGPVKALIHGAGVLQDRLIKDKSLEQFNTVFDTKAGGLRVLLEATRTDDLKYLVLFSSVSARQGNQGQVDYAMASEVLNKVARLEALQRPGCRVISINWGPWDGGMVSPSLKKEFLRRNIELIPLDTGSMYMLQEMAGNPDQPVEVVIGAEMVSGTKNSLPESPRNFAGRAENIPKKETLTPVFDTEVDVEHFPVLSSHIIGRKPVWRNGSVMAVCRIIPVCSCSESMTCGCTTVSRWTGTKKLNFLPEKPLKADRIIRCPWKFAIIRLPAMGPCCIAGQRSS